MTDPDAEDLDAVDAAARAIIREVEADSEEGHLFDEWAVTVSRAWLARRETDKQQDTKETTP